MYFIPTFFLERLSSFIRLYFIICWWCDGEKRDFFLPIISPRNNFLRSLSLHCKKTGTLPKDGLIKDGLKIFSVFLFSTVGIAIPFYSFLCLKDSFADTSHKIKIFFHLPECERVRFVKICICIHGCRRTKSGEKHKILE